MTLNGISVSFLPIKTPRYSRKGRPLVTYKDKKLCAIACLKEFISRWNVIVGLDCKQFIINPFLPNIPF